MMWQIYCSNETAYIGHFHGMMSSFTTSLTYKMLQVTVFLQNENRKVLVLVSSIYYFSIEILNTKDYATNFKHQNGQSQVVKVEANKNSVS